MNRSDLVFAAIGKKNGFAFSKMVKFVMENQYWGEEQIYDYQLSELKKIVQHAYENVPYYHRTMNSLGMIPADIKSLHDIDSFPVIGKKEIMRDFNDFLAKDYIQYHPMHRTTGGTTGVPFKYYNDIESWGLNWATKIRTFSWGGHSFGSDKIAILKGGSMVNQGKFDLKTNLWRLLQRNYTIHIMHLTDDMLEKHVRHIVKHRIQYLRGYPSAIYVFARYLFNKGEVIRMKGIFTTAEMLHGYQRDLIERVFECSIIDAYGCGEGMAGASQCELHKGYHTNIETCILEVLKSDGTVAAKGEEGEIVVSSLHDYAMPFIRYTPGDLAINGSQVCDCGRKLPIIDKIIGRTSDLIELSNGRIINGLSIPFEAMTEVLEKFQIVQEDKDLLVLYIVPKNEYSVKDEKMIMDLMTHIVGKGIGIKINKVDNIPHTSAGKFKYVISKLTKTEDEK